LLRVVRPYVIMKRKQVDLMIEIIKKKEKVNTDKDFKKLLTLIDKYRNINYSKKRKIHTLTP